MINSFTDALAKMSTTNDPVVAVRVENAISGESETSIRIGSNMMNDMRKIRRSSRFHTSYVDTQSTSHSAAAAIANAQAQQKSNNIISHEIIFGLE